MNQIDPGTYLCCSLSIEIVLPSRAVVLNLFWMSPPHPGQVGEVPFWGGQIPLRNFNQYLVFSKKDIYLNM